MLALSTDSLKGYGLNRIFSIVKAAKYDGIDLAIDPKNYDTQNAQYIKSLIDQTGVPVLAIQTPVLSSPRKIMEAVNMAKILGTRIIVIQPPKIFDFKYVQWMKNEIPKLRQKESISIALENASSQTFLGLIPENAMGSMLDLKKFKHACLDTSRVAQRREDLIRTYKSLQKFLVHVHVSNVRSGKYYAPMEKGILPVESFLTKLKQDGFPGSVSLKLNPKFLNVGEDEKVMKALQEQKLFYDTYFTNVKIMPKTVEVPEEEGQHKA